MLYFFSSLYAWKSWVAIKEVLLPWGLHTVRKPKQSKWRCSVEREIEMPRQPLSLPAFSTESACLWVKNLLWLPSTIGLSDDACISRHLSAMTCKMLSRNHPAKSNLHIKLWEEIKLGNYEAVSFGVVYHIIDNRKAHHAKLLDNFLKFVTFSLLFNTLPILSSLSSHGANYIDPSIFLLLILLSICVFYPFLISYSTLTLQS